MQAISTGAGFAALGFWLFIAAAVIAGVWDSIRKRDAQHETLRRIVESGQQIDTEFTDKLLQVTGGSRDLARDLWVSGLITLSVAPGLGVFGWVMSAFVEPLLLPIMLAVAGLVSFVACGLLLASRYVQSTAQAEFDFGEQP